MSSWNSFDEFLATRLKPITLALSYLSQFELCRCTWFIPLFAFSLVLPRNFQKRMLRRHQRHGLTCWRFLAAAQQGTDLFIAVSKALQIKFTLMDFCLVLEAFGGARIRYFDIKPTEGATIFAILPIHLYLIFEKSSLKNQVRWTGTQAVKIQFEID